MNDITILVVDDQHLVRTGLVRMLDDMPGYKVIGEADSGEAAIEKVKKLTDADKQPNVVLMDLRMPGIGGLEATRKISYLYPDIKIVAVTGCDEQPFPQRFLESGASGFVTKDAGIDEVVLAIQTVCSGKRYLSQNVAQEMALNGIGGTQVQDGGSPFDSLSERELQTSLMIIDGLKTSDIAEKLNVSPKTVNTWRYRLFEKLKISSNMELALLATRHGLIESNASSF